MIKIFFYIDEKILTIYIKRDIDNPPWLKPSIFFNIHMLITQKTYYSLYLGH